jgi:hypothetical protein
MLVPRHSPQSIYEELMMRCIILLSAFAFVCPAIARAGDVSVVAGEPALLNVLRDAQRAKLGGFPHGEMQVMTEQGYRRPGEQIARRVEALVKWDGEESYAIGTVADYMENERRTKSQPFEVLYNKKRRLYYLPDAKLERITQVEEGKFPPLTRLRPDEWWYGNIDGEGNTWVERLDGFVRMPTDVLRHCHILRLDDDRIEFVREGGGDIPGRFRAVFSLSKGGNVLKFEMFDPSSGIRAEYDYTWDRAKGGGWYPVNAQITYHFPAARGSEAFERFHRYEVRSFDPTVRPPQSTFADSAIRPRAGTVVEHGHPGIQVLIEDR